LPSAPALPGQELFQLGSIAVQVGIRKAEAVLSTVVKSPTAHPGSWDTNSAWLMEEKGLLKMRTRVAEASCDFSKPQCWSSPSSQ